MNSVLMTTYVAGTILSQASFSTMTECTTARDNVLLLNAGQNISVACSYQGKPKVKASGDDKFAEFDKLVNKFFTIIDKMREQELKHFEKMDELGIKPKCGNLAVEPNEWIRTNPYNESSSYEPITGDGRRCGTF